MEYAMECRNCEQSQRKFYCDKCLRTHLREFRKAIDHISVERDELITKSERSLEAIDNSRTKRADVAMLHAKVDQIRENLKKLREQNEITRERLASLRASHTTRRQTLAANGAPTLTPTSTQTRILRIGSTNNVTSVNLHQLNSAASQTSHLTPEFRLMLTAQANLQDALARARSGLVQELVEVFSIVEVGGRPPLGGKAGTKGEWTIGGLVLPVPGDIRRYPPVQINAVITHTIHFLGLLTFYLGVKLPFDITWSGAKLGVGQPSIYASKGNDTGGWARWSSKNPLHLPMNPTPSTSSSASPMTAFASPSSPETEADEMSASQSVAELHVQALAQTPASFTTALTMLLYNVAYLAHTQAVDVPLSQTGEVLRNLWAVCCSSELGKRAHETHPHLPAPTPPGFALDFSQLLQATTANPAPRSRPRSRRSSGTGTSARTTSRKFDKIAEEDEWEVVDG